MFEWKNYSLLLHSIMENNHTKYRKKKLLNNLLLFWTGNVWFSWHQCRCHCSFPLFAAGGWDQSTKGMFWDSYFNVTTDAINLLPVNEPLCVSVRINYPLTKNNLAFIYILFFHIKCPQYQNKQVESNSEAK